MAAPACRIAPPPPTFDTTAPPLPSIPIAQVPSDFNIPLPIFNALQSLAEAINAIRHVLNAMTNRGAPSNNTQRIQPLSGGGVSTANSGPTKAPQQQQQKNQQKKGAGLREIGRTVTKVKVTNPDDEDQYVIVNQVTSLTLKDPVSGLTWKWDQKDPLNINSP